MAEHAWDESATEQALLDLQAAYRPAAAASAAMHRYAAAALARNDDWRPAHRALLQLHVEQTPGASMPDDDTAPDDWLSTSVPYVVLRSLARWLAWLGHPSAAPLRRELSIDDIARKARDTLVIVEHYDQAEGETAGEPSGAGEAA